MKYDIVQSRSGDYMGPSFTRDEFYIWLEHLPPIIVGWISRGCNPVQLNHLGRPSVDYIHFFQSVNLRFNLNNMILINLTVNV